MNEPKFMNSKTNLDMKPKLALKIINGNPELVFVEKSAGLIQALGKSWIKLTRFFKNLFKNKNDLTFEQWQRMESKPTRRSS